MYVLPVYVLPVIHYQSDQVQLFVGLFGGCLELSWPKSEKHLSFIHEVAQLLTYLQIGRTKTTKLQVFLSVCLRCIIHGTSIILVVATLCCTLIAA